MSSNVLILIVSFVLVTDLVMDSVLSLTYEEYKAFKGKLDPGQHCGDQGYLIEECNRVAGMMNYIKPGESLSFINGYPECKVKSIRFEKNSNKPDDPTHVDTVLLDCSSYDLNFYLGRGQTFYGFYRYDCKFISCTPQGDIPYAT